MLANGHQLWVLFGDEASAGEISPGLPYVMLPAPRGQWSLQTLDAGALFAQAGLNTDSSTTQFVVGYDQYYFRRTRFRLRLMLQTRGLRASSVTAEFGSLVTSQMLPDRATMAAEALARPDLQLLWRADQNREARNFAEAEIGYRQALEANPDAVRAYIGLGWIDFAYRRYDEAADNFQRAIDTLVVALPEHDLASLGEAQAGLGWILVRQGECEQALVYLDQARRLETQLDYDLLNQELEACDTPL